MQDVVQQNSTQMKLNHCFTIINITYKNSENLLVHRSFWIVIKIVDIAIPGSISTTVKKYESIRFSIMHHVTSNHPE